MHHLLEKFSNRHHRAMKLLIISILCPLLFVCCTPRHDLQKASNDLAIQAFEYGYTTCEAGIPRDEARKILKAILIKK